MTKVFQRCVSTLQSYYVPTEQPATCELCGTIANVQVLANGARICAECREALREAK